MQYIVIHRHDNKLKGLRQSQALGKPILLGILVGELRRASSMHLHPILGCTTRKHFTSSASHETRSPCKLRPGRGLLPTPQLPEHRLPPYTCPCNRRASSWKMLETAQQMTSPSSWCRRTSRSQWQHQPGQQLKLSAGELGWYNSISEPPSSKPSTQEF